MSARDELFRRVSGAFVNEDKANQLLDDYRAEVLREAADELRTKREAFRGGFARGVHAAQLHVEGMADAAEAGESR